MPNIQSIWHSYAQAIHSNFANTLVAGPGNFEDINYATNFINGEGTTIDLVTITIIAAKRGPRRPPWPT